MMLDPRHTGSVNPDQEPDHPMWPHHVKTKKGVEVSLMVVVPFQ